VSVVVTAPIVTTVVVTTVVVAVPVIITTPVIIPVVVTIIVAVVIQVVIPVIFIADKIAVAVADGHAGSNVVIGIRGAKFGFQNRAGGVVIDDFHLFIVADRLDLGFGDATGHLDGGIAIALKLADQPVGVDVCEACPGGKSEKAASAKMRLVSNLLNKPLLAGFLQEAVAEGRGVSRLASQPRPTQKAADETKALSARGLGPGT